MNVRSVRRAPVTIRLSDGEERRIRFTMNTFAALEEEYGSIDAAIEKMESGSMLAIRKTLYLGLKAEGGVLTEEEVGDLIEIRDLEDIMKQLTAAMGIDLPEESQVGNPNE